ncbi:MAG: VPGUxxT family thioredoxin-like (seleno)protein, type 2 [Bacteroidota bacterium]
MRFLPIFLFVLLPIFLFAQQPIELGQVTWLRDIDEAQQLSEKEDKPIFLLFQEVPGCSTCQRYGEKVLSHPLIVEAIETCFISLAIHNNKRGKDREVLDYFGEPSWNNPVVRIIDAERQDLMPRLSSNYTPLAVVQSMIHILKNPPSYLRILQEELLAVAGGTKTTTLSMYCFWSGELNIGAIEGVVATELGFMHGREVVQVEYSPIITDYATIIKTANAAKCADRAFVHDEEEAKTATQFLGKQQVRQKGNFRFDKGRKYYLSKTHYRFVPMTPLQAIRANHRIANRQSLGDVLSPRQLALAAKIKQQSDKQWKNQIGEPIEAGMSLLLP